MTNVGSGPLAISAIGVTGQGIQVFSEANNCGALLAANTFCAITATFTCKKSGNFSGDLSITDNGIGSPQKVHVFAKCKADMTTSVVRSALEKQAAIKAPAATGPFTVGTSVMDAVDTVREDPYLANGTPRELLLRYWYPTAANADCKPAEYTAPKVWSRFSELMGARLPAISTNSCMDAPISEGAHPIVIFTPGYTGTFTDYTFLFEELASRGYIVVSVAHTYESTAVEFPDGRLVESVLGSHLGGSLRGEAAVMAFAVTVRLRDIEFVVNELDRINANVGSPLAGKLDVSRIALAGHSMGGVTALLGVQNSPRFKAGVSIDGDATDAVVGPMQTPFLIVAMGRKQWSDEECHLWGNLNGARVAVNFSGAEHMTPTDGVWIARGAIPAGDMGMDLMLVALRKHIVEFLDATLAGDSRNDPLSDPSQDFPGVTMVTRSQSLCTSQ